MCWKVIYICYNKLITNTLKGVRMEEKFYVDIKDDYGKVRTFEVPTLEMKIAIDNIDKELKVSYKHDALKNAVPFSVFPNEDYVSRFANNDDKLITFFKTERNKLNKALWQVVKNMANEKYKKILYMRFKNNIKFNKIAEKLGCSKQSISDNYKTAIDDLRVLLCENKSFRNTYYFKQFRHSLKVNTSLVGKEKLKEFDKTKNFLGLTTIENMIEVFDLIKTTQKKENKLNKQEDAKNTFKRQKLSLFGKTYSVQDIFDIVGEFLEHFRENKEKIK